MICDLDGTSAGPDLHLELLIVNFALKQPLMKTPAFHDVPWQLCTPAALEKSNAVLYILCIHNNNREVIEAKIGR